MVSLVINHWSAVTGEIYDQIRQLRYDLSTQGLTPQIEARMNVFDRVLYSAKNEHWDAKAWYFTFKSSEEFLLAFIDKMISAEKSRAEKHLDDTHGNGSAFRQECILALEEWREEVVASGVKPLPKPPVTYVKHFADGSRETYTYTECGTKMSSGRMKIN